MSKILILQGPNLNLLGTREPDVYGTTSLETLHQALDEASSTTLEFFQSNAEHALIDRIHQAVHDDINAIIFNPAAFTHTSIALRDAILASKIPLILVHISDPHQREGFRHRCFFSDIALTSIVGQGVAGYHLALKQAEQFIKNQSLVH
jgi:3-dehydroquinate dehydratase II